MSEIYKIIVLLSLLGFAFFANAKYNYWYYKWKILPHIEEQKLINKGLNHKLNELQDTDNYLEFSLDVNNKLIEEILTEQIQKKGD